MPTLGAPRLIMRTTAIDPENARRTVVALICRILADSPKANPIYWMRLAIVRGKSMTDRPYGEIMDEMDHQAKYQPATNLAEANPVTSATLAEFLHGHQPLMLGGRSQPLSVYLEFARLILSEFNMQRKPPLSP